MKKSLAATMALAICLTGMAASSSPAAAESADVVLSRGHIDMFEVSFAPTANVPQLLVKDDTELYAEGFVFRDPENVVIDADSEQAAFEIPEGLEPEYAFLGQPGETVYMVPEVQDEDLPWPGWSTERLKSTTPEGTTLSTAPDAVKIALDISGPGEVHTFMSGSFGEVVNHFVDTTDNLPDVLPVSTQSHVHTTWLFTEPGDYTISATPSVATAGGDVLTGEAVDYRFHIGDPIAPVIPVPVAPGPTITGSPVVGSQLLGGDGRWTPAPTEYVARQWQRDGADIPGATQGEYTVQAADAGHALTFRSTVRIGREIAGATSAAVRVPGQAISNTGKPTVASSPRVGAPVAATAGSWSTGGLAYAFQWLRNGTAIAGATGSTYRPVAGDRGKLLAVRVRTTKSGFAAGSATSAARAVGLGTVLRATTAPRLSGKVRVGKILKVSSGRWTPSATTTSYQWRVAGKVVRGSTGASFKLRRAHKGKRVTVTVVAKRPGHAVGSTRITTGRVK